MSYTTKFSHSFNYFPRTYYQQSYLLLFPFFLTTTSLHFATINILNNIIRLNQCILQLDVRNYN